MKGGFASSLTWQMAIATVLGILCGFLFGQRCAFLAPWSDAYISILKITIIPYLMFAIMHGVAQFTSTQAKTILKTGLLFFTIACLLNIGMIYFAKALLPTLKGTHALQYGQGANSQIDFAELLIPQNIFYDLAHNIIPAVVIFSLLVGIALMHLPRRQDLMELLETLISIFTKITYWISRITPIGTFIIMAYQIGSIEFQTIQQIVSYLVIYMLTLSIVIFWIYPQLIHILTPVSAREWVRSLLPALVLGYTTNVVIIALPYIIQTIQKKLEELYPKNPTMQNLVQGTVSVSFNLPMSSMFLSVFILFSCVLYNAPLSFPEEWQLFFMTMLVSLGAVGLGSWINNLSFIFNSLSLPSEGINLYLTTVPFTAGLQSMAGVMQTASLAFIIVLGCHKQIHYKFFKIIRRFFLSCIPILVILIGLKIYNPFPPLESNTPTLMALSRSTKVVIQMSSREEAHHSRRSSNNLFEQILDSNRLKVGYSTSAMPFCFYNDKQEVTGYDISFAIELAYDLGCNLELIPLDYSHLEEDLNSGLYDVAMSAVSVTSERLRSLVFSQPYLSSPLIFVTTHKMRSTFKNLESVQATPTLKIAVLAGTSYEKLAQQLFPGHTIVPLQNFDKWDITSNPRSLVADAIFWEKDQATAWVASRPLFEIVDPTPSLGSDNFAYAIRSNEERFLNFLNEWLELKKNSGFAETQEQIWIEGQTQKATQEATE